MSKIRRYVLLLCALAMACAVLPSRAEADDVQTVPLLMIVVEFADEGGGKPVAYDDSYDWTTSVFGGDDSLASYYLDMSNGTFTFVPAEEKSALGLDGNRNKADAPNDGVVHITLPEAHGAWGLVNEDDAVAQVFGKVVMRAFRESAAYVDYAHYDTDGDTLLAPDELAVCICVAGYDASALVEPGRTDIPVIWPHAGVLSEIGGVEAQSGELRPASYIAVAERLWYENTPIEETTQEPIGIVYHELGHYLGLPDLYPLNPNPESGPWGAWVVGRLSVMDTGGWAEVDNGDGTFRGKPTAFDSWSRYVLGWELPQIVTESGDYRLSSQMSESGYNALLIPTQVPDQYFLLENRQPEGHDESFAADYAEGNPTGGVVIWHVDKGVYQQYALSNEANNTTHRPAIMAQYLEVTPDGTAFTTDWATGQPNILEPFYDLETCVLALGDGMAAVELPLYGNEVSGDAPAMRYGSGITVQFPTQTGRDMTVHVEFASTEAGTCEEGYALGEEEKAALRTEGGALGDIASAALISETGADVALVDVGSIRAGLPAGTLSYADAAAVLPSDSVIERYDMTGAQLLELIEESLECNLACRSALKKGVDLPDDGNGVLCTAGLSYTVDWGAKFGQRLGDVRVGRDALDSGKVYSVALTQGIVHRYGLEGRFNRDILVLWGSPADAMRSFVARPAWEAQAQELAGEQTYVEPPAPEAILANPDLSLPIIIATVVGVLAVVLIGVSVTMIARRR